MRHQVSPRAPASWRATGTSSIATSGWKTRSNIPPKRSWASRSTARSATITSTTRSPRPTITRSGLSSSRTRFAPTRCRGSPTPTKAGLVRVYDETGRDADIRLRARRRETADQGKAAGAVGAQDARASSAGLEPISPLPLPPEAFYPGMNGFVREQAINRSSRRDRGSEERLSAPAERALADARDPARGRESRACRCACQEESEGGRGRSSGARRQDRGRRRSLFVAACVPDAGCLHTLAGRLDRKRALLQAEEALLKAEIADLEARNAPKQPGKAQDATAGHRDAAQECARGCRRRAEGDERRCRRAIHR